MKKKKKKQTGFTIIEVLMAFTLLSIMMVVLANVFSSVSQSYSLADRKTDIYQNARIVLDQISREIKGAVIYNEAGRYGFFIRSAGASTWVSNSVGSELFFIAPWKVNDAQTSNLVEFGYYLDGGPTADLHDNILKRCAVPDTSASFNYLISTTWPQGNPYVDIAYNVRNFTVSWYGAFPTALDAEAWRPQEYNPIPLPGAYRRDRIPRAVRIHIEMLHPDDFKKYGATAKMDQVTLSFDTIVYLNNSIPFN